MIITSSFRFKQSYHTFTAYLRHTKIVFHIAQSSHNLVANKVVPIIGTFSLIHINYATDITDKIKPLDLFSGKMVNFDVDSLFTIAPINDVLEFLANELLNCDIDLSIPVDYFHRPGNDITSNAFSFNNKTITCIFLG